MAKIVPSIRSKTFNVIATLVILATVFGGFSWFSALSAEAAAAELFQEHAFVRATNDTRGYRYELFAAHCVQHSRDNHVIFVDDFNGCVAASEYKHYSMGRSIPSEVCIRNLPEKSREQILCIIAAETPVVQENIDRVYQENAAPWQEVEARRKAEQAEQQVRQAKRDAEEKAVAPKIQAAIDKLAPKSDQERRMAALTASCAYAEGETGYRLAYQAYARASQQGIDAPNRFEGGRRAICNENQVKGR